MGQVLVVVAFAVAVVAIAVGGLLVKQRRRQAFAVVARQLGLSYAQDDPFGTLGEPFHLFTLGDGRGIENVVWGSFQGVDVRAFDYWYYERTSNGKGGSSRTYYRFDCAVVRVDAACSPVTIDHENLFTRLADHLAMHDLEFESQAFNDAYNVKSSDPRFATALLDARMMQWLLDHGDGYRFEVVGDGALVIGGKIAPQALVPLLGTAIGFRQHVPSVLSSLYPRSGPG